MSSTTTADSSYKSSGRMTTFSGHIAPRGQHHQQGRREAYTSGRAAGALVVGASGSGAARHSGDLNGPDVAKTTNAAAVEDSAKPQVAPLKEDKDIMNFFLFLKIVTWISAIYMSASTWAFFYEPDTGEICPYRVICATTWLEKILLTFSRLSAGALFAALAITVKSKCYSTKAFLHHSWFGAVVDIEPSHDIHTYFGYIMFVAGVEHGVLHIIRFCLGGDADILYTTNVGRSGVICMLLLFPIVLPMKFKWFKDRMNFETRKRMHLLFLPMIIGLCFHSLAFRYVGAILIMWYTMDRFYFTTKQTFLIQHPTFEAVGRGTMVGLDLPPSYDFKAGSYIYVNCPAISRAEWHPFSIIPVPGTSNTAAFYAEGVGDWTRALFRLGLDQPRLPLWITAAQPSTMDKTVYYDKVVLVCTGAGITPGISIAQRYAEKKQIHLLWITRDGGMVALFEKQLRLVCSTVYLTGKPDTEVKLALTKLLASSTDELEKTGSVGSNLGRSCSADGAARLDGHSRDNSRGAARPSVLEITRASLLHHSPRGPPPAYSISIAHLQGVEEKDEVFPKRGFMTSTHSRPPSYSSATWGILPASRNPAMSFPGPLTLSNKSLVMDEFERKAPPSPDHTTGRADKDNSDTPSRRRMAMRSGDGDREVKLVFGRPDIKEYLLDILSGAQKEVGDAEAPEKAIVRGTRNPRQLSARLNGHQQQSKAILLVADKNMVQSLGKAHDNQAHAAKKPRSSTGETACAADSPSHNKGGNIRDSPLVLYCGANPKVEAVIESTCADNGVPWKKEYFGAW